MSVYFAIEDATFGSKSTEMKGHFVGISKHVGHLMIYKILTYDTLRIFHALTSILQPIHIVLLL